MKIENVVFGQKIAKNGYSVLRAYVYISSVMCLNLSRAAIYCSSQEGADINTAKKASLFKAKWPG